MSTPNPKTVWSRLYDDVKMQIPGVVDAVFKQMLYQVWGDFTDRTNIWTEECPIAVVPDTLVYPVTIQKKGMANRLMLVYDPLQVPPRRWVQQGIEMTIPAMISLMYAPSSAATWNAVIAKSTDEVDSDGYPALDPSDNWIVDKYGDGLHYGVLGRLMAMPAKPYTNLKLGAQNWQVYIAERSKARGDTIKSNVFGAQRWAFPQGFAAVNRKGWT